MFFSYRNFQIQIDFRKGVTNLYQMHRCFLKKKGFDIILEEREKYSTVLRFLSWRDSHF